MAKDYYEILGLTRNATADEIKKASRKLKGEWHPDRHNNSKESNIRFQEINEAAEVLNDPKKKSEFDTFGTTGSKTNGFGGSGFGRSPFDDLFSGFRGNSRTNAGFNSPFDDLFNRGSSAYKNTEVKIDVVLSVEEATLGADKVVSIQGDPITLKIESGVSPYTKLKFTNKGKSENLDILVNIKIKEDAFKIINNRDIETVLRVPLEDLFMGGSAMAMLPNSKKIKLTIEPNTEAGSRKRIAGQGLPARKQDPAGDLYIILEVDTSLIPEEFIKNLKK